MSLNLHKALKSFLLAAILLPAIAFANTEFKGTETVNINRADAATLAAYLRGVGVNKAKNIVAYRKANGKFKSIEDLKIVPGIGDVTFKDNKRKMSISRGKFVAPEGYVMGEANRSNTPRKKAKKRETRAAPARRTVRDASNSGGTARRSARTEGLSLTTDKKVKKIKSKKKKLKKKKAKKVRQ